MGCDCGKPKRDGHCGVSPSVLQINNPSECVLFHRVEVPASMGDSTTNPPKPGAYRNTLLYYKADGEAFLYSSDGIPTKITGVANDYACLENKPQINGVTLEGNKSLNDIGVTDAINNALEPYTPTSNLATVATSGSYDDLTDKPTIPTVNDATLTIQKEGSSIGTFTANSATNTTVNIVETDPTVPSWAKQPTKPTYSYSEITDKPTIPAAQVNSDWNANSGVAEILNKPTIPTVNNATLIITQNGTSAGTFTANASSNTTINLTDTTYSNFSGATSSAAGASGLVPAPAAGDQTKYLMGNGTWGEVQLPPSRTVLYVQTNLSYLTSPFYIYKDSSRTTPITWEEMRTLLNAEDGGEVVIRVMDSSDSTYCIVSFEHDMAWFGVIDASQEHDSAAIYHFHEDYDDPTRSKFVIEKQEIGGGLTELSYGNSTWSDFITAYQAKKVVYCRASSNSNPATGSQTRKAFMAYVNNATNPTEVEFQYVRSVSTKTSSQPVDQIFVYKLTSANGGTWTVETRDVAPKLAQGTNTTVSYSNGTYTISASGGPSVVQTVGTSTTSVMSQNAVTGLIYYDPSTRGTISIGTANGYEVTGGIQIGDGALAPEDYSIAIGYNARGSDGGYPYKGIAIGANAYVWSEGGVAIGADTNIQAGHSVAIGDKSYVGSLDNEYVVSVGRPSNVSNPFTRRIINVTDPINAQDAATKNYVDTVVGNIETILQTLNSGTGAQ